MGAYLPGTGLSRTWACVVFPALPLLPPSLERHLFAARRDTISSPSRCGFHDADRRTNHRNAPRRFSLGAVFRKRYA